MLALILLVVSVALADAVNPSTLAPALLLATARHGAARQLARFTLGVFVVSLAGGLVLLLGPGQLLLDAIPHPGHHARAVLEVIGGVVLIGLAAALWFGRHAIARRLSADPSESSSDRGAFALGAGIMAIELPSAVPYFAAIAAILAEHVPLAGRLLLVLFYNLVFVAPLVALIAVRQLAGQRAEKVFDAIGFWLRERAPVLLAGLLAVLGVIVAAIGVAGLA